MYFKLNEENFNKSLEENKDKKFVIKLWHSYCQYSKQFQPVWEEIVKNDDVIDNLAFADIECMQNANICNKLASPTYPRVFYIEPKYNFTFEMQKPLTLNRTLQFIKEMEYYPCIFDSSDQIEENAKMNEKKASLFEPFFEYQIPNNNNQELEDKISLVRTAFISANVSSSHVLCKLINNDREKLIVYDNSQGESYAYNGKFEKNELVSFIEAKSMKQVIGFNQKSWNILRKSGSKFFIFSSKNQMQYSTSKNMAISLSKKKTNNRFLLDDPNEPYVSSVFSIPNSISPLYIIYVDTSSSKYCVYDLIFKQENIESWTDSMLTSNSHKCSSYSNDTMDDDVKYWKMWGILLSFPIILCVFIVYFRIPKHQRHFKTFLPL